MACIRLDKYLADAGCGTRSQVKDIIKKNRVMVGDVPVKKADIRIDTEKDEVFVDGKKLCYEEYEYFMLNKPQGVVSSTRDERDKTVVELIAQNKRRDLFPVGRLDKDTEGLLIITNDGKLANNLLAPCKHVDKTYLVRVDGEINQDMARQIMEGVDIGDETLTAPAILRDIRTISLGEDCVTEAKITITEGRYHQIKRMFKSVGRNVIFLKRLTMGPLVLDERLACGEYRRLTTEEINLLKEAHLR